MALSEIRIAYYERRVMVLKFNEKQLKVIGLFTAIAGMGLNFISNWVSDLKLDEKVEKKVNAALEQREKDES